MRNQGERNYAFKIKIGFFRPFWGGLCWLRSVVIFINFVYTVLPIFLICFFLYIFYITGEKCTFGWWKIKISWKFRESSGLVYGLDTDLVEIVDDLVNELFKKHLLRVCMG
jgi:hypothetical protein